MSFYLSIKPLIEHQNILIGHATIRKAIHMVTRNEANKNKPTSIKRNTDIIGNSMGVSMARLRWTKEITPCNKRH